MGQNVVPYTMGPGIDDGELSQLLEQGPKQEQYPLSTSEPQGFT